MRPRDSSSICEVQEAGGAHVPQCRADTCHSLSGIGRRLRPRFTGRTHGSPLAVHALGLRHHRPPRHGHGLRALQRAWRAAAAAGFAARGRHGGRRRGARGHGHAGRGAGAAAACRPRSMPCWRPAPLTSAGWAGRCGARRPCWVARRPRRPPASRRPSCARRPPACSIPRPTCSWWRCSPQFLRPDQGPVLPQAIVLRRHHRDGAGDWSMAVSRSARPGCARRWRAAPRPRWRCRARVAALLMAVAAWSLLHAWRA